MGPGGSLVAQGAKAVGTLAVQKVAPKLLAIGALSGTVTYMNNGGGKDSSKDTGGERVVPSADSKVRYHENMVKSGKWKRCTGEWRGYFEGEVNGTTYRFKPTVEKNEFEVYRKFAGKGEHWGVLQTEGPEAGKVLEQFAKHTIWAKW
jgi:hypothetical protein